MAVHGAKMSCPRCQSKPVLEPEIGTGPDFHSLIHETTGALMFKPHPCVCLAFLNKSSSIPPRSLTIDKGFGYGMRHGKWLLEPGRRYVDVD